MVVLRRRKRLISFIVLVIVLASFIVINLMDKFDLIQCISLFTAILGVVLVAVELFQSRKVAEADFLASLNNSFVTSEDYKAAYMMFENYDFENCPDLELDNVHISNYLTFFETFQLLIERGTLSISMLNDLFGYRFFIAVHNPYVQRKKLVNSPDNFKNLYLLEKEWMAYRKKKGLPIFHEEYSLEKQLDEATYKRIISQAK